MFSLNDKEKCCGCSACVSVCPVSAIGMEYDEEGFLYPSIDDERCIHCNKCIEVCPVLNLFPPNPEPDVEAAVCKDKNVLSNSSSGGVFSCLSEKILEQGGYVWGAAWDASWNVRHIGINTSQELWKLQGSKYVQSCLKDVYPVIAGQLKNGIPVLFSGTPCQISGLKVFLGKEYCNLLTVAIICHGVPSPGVWQVWLNGLCRKKNIKEIHHILFRKRIQRRGVCNSSFFEIQYGTPKRIFRVPFYDLSFGRGFGTGLFGRPICYKCPFKNHNCGSDFTIGDYWGIEKLYPELNANSGISAVLINTQKAKLFWMSVREKLYIFPANYDSVKSENMVEKIMQKSPDREQFFLAWKNRSSREKVIESFAALPISFRIRKFLGEWRRCFLWH